MMASGPFSPGFARGCTSPHEATCFIPGALSGWSTQTCAAPGGVVDGGRPDATGAY